MGPVKQSSCPLKCYDGTLQGTVDGERERGRQRELKSVQDVVFPNF